VEVVVAGGGTAGHVNPALALADELSGHGVTFIGTLAGAEAGLVPAAGYALELIDVRGFDRSRPLGILAAGARALGAVESARRIIKRVGADVVVGMGGYVSLPACFAARTGRVPVVLHEQNIVLGLANRVCKPLAARIAVSWEDTLEAAGEKGVHTGNPVLPGFVAADFDTERREGMERFGLDPGRRTLLVFGGSQGARRLNDAATGLARLWAPRGDRQILHITGRSGPAAADRAPAQVSDRALIYRPVEYVERMQQAYAVADLALCRGGATTVAELGVAGVPSIIVPYPHHRDHQQERHGTVLERAGAGIVLKDSEATAERVAGESDVLLDDDAGLERMRKAALVLGRPDAAARLARLVLEVAG
jgi:UDP-N-acetylglucosamine--N-acetylmuramyl-(pentapeptide) pyrophosphoryl-undecaprenol N-acetylglucosamine transferase